MPYLGKYFLFITVHEVPSGLNDFQVTANALLHKPFALGVKINGKCRHKLLFALHNLAALEI
jgi:hypothetical protein